MRLDSSQVLGSPQLAGAVVTARGSGLRHAARVPATGLVGAVSRGYLRSNLTVTFADGGSWEFEVSPFVRSMIVRIVRVLGY